MAITKASGLTATAPKNILMVKGHEKAYTYELSQVELNHNDTGTKTYTLGTLTNTYNIFKVIPSINGGTMSFTSNIIAAAATDQATQVVTISTQNYGDTTVTLTFDITNKILVTIPLPTVKSPSVCYTHCKRWMKMAIQAKRAALKTLAT